MNDVVQYALDRGINPKSKILNITHVDLDGLVSTINLMNYFEDVFYVQKNYDLINDYFKRVVFTGNHEFDVPDFIIVTDISLDEDVIEECAKRDLPLIILDHHPTAYELNKYENCYVDEGDLLSGAGVTLQFLKHIGFEGTHLDKLNKIANEFDLFLFAEDESLRKFDVEGKKRSLAEMLNTVFFSHRKPEHFIERWMDGFGTGFNAEEIEMIKKDQRDNNQIVAETVGSQYEVNLTEDIVFILRYQALQAVQEEYLDVQGKSVVLFLDRNRLKVSGRVNKNSSVNIGKIFQLLKEKTDYVDNGGGHEKAGACGITDISKLEDFLENFVKLAEFYSKKEKVPAMST